MPVIAVAVVLVAAASAFLMLGRQRASGPDIGASWPVVRSEAVGDIKVTVRSENGAFRLAASSYAIEFTNAATGRPVDVSSVSLGGTMAMPGMVMTSPGTVTAANTRGRFVVRMSFDMSGTWEMKLAWRDAGGDHAVTFDGDVQ
jgi:hypothetical protein